MRRSGVVLAASGFLLAAIMLSGCQPAMQPAGPGNAATKPAEVGELKLVSAFQRDGTCDVFIGLYTKTAHRYVWRVDKNLVPSDSLQQYDRDLIVWSVNIDRDNNSLRTAFVKAAFNWPSGLVSAYPARFGRLQWSERPVGGGCMLYSFDGIGFGHCLYPKSASGKNEVAIRDLVFNTGGSVQEAISILGNPMAAANGVVGDLTKGMTISPFRKGFTYLFCFDKIPVADGMSLGPAVDFPDMVRHLVAVVEIVPFDGRERPLPVGPGEDMAIPNPPPFEPVFSLSTFPGTPPESSIFIESLIAHQKRPAPAAAGDCLSPALDRQYHIHSGGASKE
jgi:hypothetical protein